LPHVSEIKHELEASQSFVISVNTSQAALDELSYEAKPDRVDIFLKPKTGKFSQTDVSFKSARFPYDLIITLHTPSLDNLGEIYEKNTDLFFETPIINIDHHPNNEYYGQINHVDLTATSTAEIVANLIEEFESGLMDESIATSLLTGIIVETNSFQHVKTTPKAFLKASQLIAQGGRHQDIIRELYKTKSISLLKLWGRALARLREIKELSMAYSIVNFQDIEKTAAKPEDISGVMKELVVSLTESHGIKDNFVSCGNRSSAGRGFLSSSSQREGPGVCLRAFRADAQWFFWKICSERRESPRCGKRYPRKTHQDQRPNHSVVLRITNFYECTNSYIRIY